MHEFDYSIRVHVEIDHGTRHNVPAAALALDASSAFFLASAAAAASVQTDKQENVSFSKPANQARLNKTKRITYPPRPWPVLLLWPSLQPQRQLLPLHNDNDKQLMSSNAHKNPSEEPSDKLHHQSPNRAPATFPTFLSIRSLLTDFLLVSCNILGCVFFSDINIFLGGIRHIRSLLFLYNEQGAKQERLAFSCYT
jgi:hypothetical protein